MASKWSADLVAPMAKIVQAKKRILVDSTAVLV
jgi:hypothetical protein